MIDRRRLHPYRVAQGLMRRISEMRYAREWDTHESALRSKSFLRTLKNQYAGKRLFLIANGPSIKDMDLSVLKNEYTMCMNRFYIYFDKIGFIPTFFVCVEDLVLSQFAEDFNQIPIEAKFVNWRMHKEIQQSFYLKESFALNPFFQTDLTQPTHFGGTVTFACLQLAYHMGFTQVILIGLDHNFKEKGLANKVEVRSYEKDESHFDPNYFPKGMKWRLPDLTKSEIGYALARDFYQKNGRDIFDATINGHCQIFPKVDFQQLIRQTV